MKVSTDSAIRLDKLHFQCMKDQVKAAEFMQCYLVEPAVALPVGDEPVVLKVRYTGHRALGLKPGQSQIIGTGLYQQSRLCTVEGRDSKYWGKRGVTATMDAPFGWKDLPRELKFTLYNPPGQHVMIEVGSVVAEIVIHPIKA